MPVGAEVQENGTHFRVWAPGRETVEAVVEDGGTTRLQEESGGYFAGTSNLKFWDFVSLAPTVIEAVCVPNASCQAVIS